MLEVFFNGVPKESMKGCCWYWIGDPAKGRADSTGLVTLPRAGLTLQVIHKGAKAVNAECAFNGASKEAQDAMLEVFVNGIPKQT